MPGPHKPALTALELESLLWDACSKQIGLVVETDNPLSLKQRLINVRAALAKTGITDFDHMTFRPSPENPTTELWIITSGKVPSPRKQDRQHGTLPEG